MSNNYSLIWMNTDTFIKKEYENPNKLKLINRKISDIKKTLDDFQQKYPTPEVWLQDSPNCLDKEEFEYVLVWLTENDFINTNDKIKIFKILLKSPIKRQRILRWAYYYNFITIEHFQEILNAFSSLKIGGGTNKLLLHLFYFKKPFGTLSKNENEEFFNMFDKKKLKPYTHKILTKILFHFGYSKSIQKPLKKPSPNKEHLINHPIYGKAFLEYDNFLNSNGTTPNSISERYISLKRFIKYLDHEGYRDASKINEETLIDFIDFLLDFGLKESSITTSFPHIQHFLDWTLGSYNFFPKEIIYPDEAMSKVRKKAREHREETDGLAFKDDRFPDLTVVFLKQFVPTNEIEFLCSRFWMIIASCATRQGFVLNLEYNNCMYPLLNEKNIYGLYSSDTDKAKNKNGQFPIIDSMGVAAIQELEKRIETNLDSFKPIINPKSNRVFIHLFQLKNSNQVLDKNQIYLFQKNYIVPYIAQKLNITNVDSISFGTHAFRHYLLTHIVKKTGDEETAQAAAGHHDGKMIRRHYIKSKFAKKALLHRAIDKYESGEITGKFYLRLIEKLTNENDFNSELMKDLESEMELDEFIKKHGRVTDMGYCFDEDHTCNHYMKCWNCPSFMMRREEISGAIKLLRKLINDYLRMRSYSKDFSYENTLVQNNIRAISMIKERLSDLKYTDEQIETMLYSENI